MVAWSVRREHRPVPRAAAALVVLLAALVHLLGCAHGPVPAGFVRTDTPLLLAAVCDRTCAPDAVASTWPAPAPGDEQPHCRDADEPTVQPPRGIAPPAPAVAGAAPAAADHAKFPSPRSGPPEGPTPGPATDGRSRARLGVWRS
ncbi:hypothetical protein [Streptomyces sp. NPDC006012]|uniref:hypothetical protein n=1 Tax=Streptomyces sp. NPDC006012 TaxID=3364739 RepID=UPI0036D0F976